MRIGIVGAGAIGGWLGVRLGARGHQISVLARGETLKALIAAPWRLQSGELDLWTAVRASDQPAALGPQDLVILALKAPALPRLAPTLGPMIGPDTVVLPAMNGVPWWFLLAGGGDLGPTALAAADPDGAIAEAIPLERVIGCVVHAAAAVERPGRVIHRSGDRLILGEPDGRPSARLAAICEALADAGFRPEASGAVQREIWYKLWGNMTMNPISALTGATADRILDDPLVNRLILQVMAEAQAIGARIGCEIHERGEDRNQVTRQLGAFRTSMLQDAAAGRPIELDAMLGAPREIAQRLQLETPFMDALLGLTRVFGRTHGLYPA